MRTRPDPIPNEPQSVTMQDMYAAVGHFLFCWSSFEQQLTREIDDAGKALNKPRSSVRGGLVDRLAVWRGLAAERPHNSGKEAAIAEVVAQALDLRDIRNVIVHGLAGWNACPRNGDEPYIDCIKEGHEDPAGKRVRLTLTELEHCTAATAACSNALLRIDSFHTRVTPPRAFMTGIGVSAT